jgi:shikimate 5-dehydrogenase
MGMNLYFIGVTTAQSAINLILPAWSQALNLELHLVGIDLPIDASPQQYVDAVNTIKNDPHALGSDVTTHKTKLYEYAKHLFDEFDAMTQLTGEIVAITKKDGRLGGSAAPECASTTLTMKAMLGDAYWDKQDGALLCLGAGGAARAITLSLLCDFETDAPLANKRRSKPKKMIVVDIDERQLRSMDAFLHDFCNGTPVEYICQSDPMLNDRILTALPPGSLIVNATGMGKDRPGSPLTDRASFPAKSVVWELNYRGERKFLQQAQAQAKERQLRVHDGWLCFLNGWTQVLQKLLQPRFSLSESQFQRLAAIAEPFRPA